MSVRLFSYIVWLCLAWPFVPGKAQLIPVATLLRENGTVPDAPVVLTPGGEAYVGAAPMEFLFSTGIEEPGATLHYEWDFSEDPEFTQLFLRRYDEETSYTFERSGQFFVRLVVTDTETGNISTSDSFQFRIADSELKVPNAFSPNEDGVHDVFLVQHKSLVSFKAVVFNRWGQQLYQWGLSDIDRGWDGTSHGHPVADGVYFIVIEAQGADGIAYKIKGDINILR